MGSIFLPKILFLRCIFDVISTHHCCAFKTIFFQFYLLIVSQKRKDRTRKDIIMSQLSYTINNGFRAHNIGVKIGMSGMQYRLSYAANLFGTSNIHAPMVYKGMAVAFSVSHNDINYSSEQQDYRKTNGRTCN